MRNKKFLLSIAAVSAAAVLFSGTGGVSILAAAAQASETAAEKPESAAEASKSAVEKPDSAAQASETAAEKPDSAGAGDGIETYTDDLGRSVQVPENPERVAALTGSFADIWILAGGEESLTATAHDAWTSFDISPGEQVTDLGSAKDISLEKLLASDPDLVIGSVSTQSDMDLLPVLEETDIPTLYFDVDCFEDYLRMLEVCTKITGKEENYDRYGEGIRQQVEDAIAMQDGSRPTVLYIRASASSLKSKGSEGSVLGEMLADLGCVNIADSDESLLENLSMESILAADPDHIFIVYQGEDTQDAEQILEDTLLSNPAWETLTAVKEGRVHIMSHRLYNLRPNAQWGDAYEQAAEILYKEDTLSRQDPSGTETEA